MRYRGVVDRTVDIVFDAAGDSGCVMLRNSGRDGWDDRCCCCAAGAPDDVGGPR